MNSWCKVVDGQVVDGPRAWANDTPPDETWLRHTLEEPAHTVNDNFVGSHYEIRGGGVVEVKDFSPKSQAQINEEIQGIKDVAAQNVATADEKLANPDLGNRAEWQAFRDSWLLLTNITELSWYYKMPQQPRESEE